MTNVAIIAPQRSIFTYISDKIGSVFNSQSPAEAMSYEVFLELTKQTNKNIKVELPNAVCFFDQLENAPSSSNSISKVLSNELDRLSPLPPDDDFVVLSSLNRDTKNHSVDFLHIKSDTLSSLETHAQKLNISNLQICCEENPSIAFEAPSLVKRKKTRHNSRLFSYGLFLVAVWCCLTIIEQVQSKQYASLSLIENDIRHELISRKTLDKDLNLYSQLQSIDANQITPRQRLADILLLTQNTPKNSWWTDIEFSSDSIRISGVSPNAAQTLSEMESNIPQMQFSFDETVSDTEDGLQRFVLKITKGTNQ